MPWTALFVLLACASGWSLAIALPLWHEAGAQPSVGSVPECCGLLSHILGPLVHYGNDTQYNAITSAYWAQQELENKPVCVVAVRSARDASHAIKALTSAKCAACPFAIKGGGHGKWSASSFAQEILMDLGSMKNITLSADKKSVSVGAGAKWRDVYSALDPRNLTVAGGRSADVGVSGLSLAGGLSYLSPRVGLTTNTLVDVEIVLASGDIVHTASDDFRDVDRAIRGGTNNFGVATTFTFETIPFTGAYGGNIFYDIDSAPTLLDILHQFTASPVYDPHSTVTMSFGFSHAGTAAVVDMVHTAPIGSVPVDMLPFMNVTSLFNTLRSADMTNLTGSLASQSPVGFRQATYTLTLQSDMETILAAHELWTASHPSLSTVAGISYSFTLEPLPPATLSKTGNDVTGLERQPKRPLQIWLLSVTWQNAADDDLVLSVASKLLSDTKDRALQLGTLHPFLYAGYADRTQDVFKGVGVENQEFLSRVSERIDPKQVFLRQVQGGFKLV